MQIECNMQREATKLEAQEEGNYVVGGQTEHDERIRKSVSNETGSGKKTNSAQW